MNNRKKRYLLELISLDDNMNPIAKCETFYFGIEQALKDFKDYKIKGCMAVLYLCEMENDNIIQRFVIERKVNKKVAKLPVNNYAEQEFTEEQQKAYDLVISTINYYVDCKYAGLIISRVDELVKELSKHDN